MLTSGVGLGLYIPALLIDRRLRRRQIDVDVEVLEGYYTPDYQRAHLAQRDAHHANFALAQLAHRMARDVERCLDGDRVRPLLERWRQRGPPAFHRVGGVLAAGHRALPPAGRRRDSSTWTIAGSTR